MKPAKGQIVAAVERPSPAIRFYLFHGPDEAGSRALASRLLTALSAEKAPLSGASLRSDPAMLAAEAGAFSMFGERRLLWIEPAGNEILEAVQGLLAAPAVEHVAVAIASSLTKASPLLKLVESHPTALCHVSYVPEGREADRMVVELGRTHGLRMRPELASRIAAAAGNDQAIAEQELRKFALFLGADPARPRDLDEDAVNLLGADANDIELGRAGDLALAGDVVRLARELEQLEGRGFEPIPALRALQRRLLQVIALRSRMDAGQSMDAVMTSVFWKDKALFQKLLSRWSSERLAHALERVARLERDIMLSPAPDRAAFGGELMQMARASSR